MEQKKDTDKPLLIPENCPPLDYLIIGFTRTDSAIIAATGTVGGIFGISIYANNGNSILGVAVLFLFVVAAISILRRNEYTENLIDKLRIIREYQKSQKAYEYLYINIWEMERKKREAADRKKGNGQGFC